MLQVQNYRDVLRQELIERCRRNTRYSLRAFARDIAIEPARLSNVLNGKKGLSRDSASKIGLKIGLNKKDKDFFCDLVESEHGRNPNTRVEAKKKVESYLKDQQVNVLNIDAFKAVSEWYHFAILQLMKLDHYREDVSWISKSLGLQSFQTEDALQRLVRLGLAELKDGKHQPTGAYVSSPDGIPNEAVRKFHQQLIEKASSAIHTQPTTERDLNSHLFPIDVAQIEEARDMIRGFSKEFMKKFTSSEKSNRVYCLATQFFNLTPEMKTEM